MFGYLLLLTALILFYIPNYRFVSIILYLGFLLGTYGGYNFLTNQVIDNYNYNLAFIYTVSVLPYVLNNYNIKKYISYNIGQLILYFFVFLLVSSLFSFWYYDLEWKVIFQVVHNSFLVLSFLVFLSLTRKELIKIIRVIAIFTFFGSICYILQVLFGLRFLPYPFIPDRDPSTGLMRFYNFPELLSFYLVLSVLDKKFFYGNYISIYRIIFLMAVLLTLGRNFIISNMLGVCLAILIGMPTKKSFQYILFFSLLFLPFIGVIQDRFTENNATSNDIQMIFNKDFQDSEHFADATMAYRFGWIYERSHYLSGRPFIESVFGLGFVSDLQPISRSMYKFNLGLLNRDTGERTQLETPDIAWGTVLSRYGYTGIIFFILFFYTLFINFFKARKLRILYLAAGISVLVDLLGTFANGYYGHPKNFSFYFLLFVLLIKDLRYVYLSKSYCSYSNV